MSQQRPTIPCSPFGMPVKMHVFVWIVLENGLGGVATARTSIRLIAFGAFDSLMVVGVESLSGVCRWAKDWGADADVLHWMER